MKKKRTMIATDLSLKDKLAAFRAGMSGLSEKKLLERERCSFIELDDELGKPQRTPASARRLAALAHDDEALGKRSDDLDGLRRVAEVRGSGLKSEIEMHDRTRPALGRAVPLVLVALLLLITDGSFVFLAVADAFGVDLSSGGSSGLPLVVGVTIFTVICNAWAGTKATDRTSPRSRFWGWVLVVGIAGALAVVRGQATPDASVAITILGIILSIVAAYASGEAHHCISPIHAAFADYKNRRNVLIKSLRATEDKVREIEGEQRALVEHRHAIAAETDSIVEEPERRRARQKEIRNVLAARVAAIRYHHERGARFAGCRTDKGEGGAS